MKSKMIGIALGLALLTPAAMADRFHGGESDSYTDTAVVLKVKPIYRSVERSTPTRECWEEEVFYSDDGGRDNTALSMIVGGAVGGALGHNIGRHSDDAKIAGAVIGSAIGYDTAQRKHRRHKLRRGTEEHCQTVYEKSREEIVDGYRVTYRYNGRTLTTITDQHPGNRLRVRVSVLPLE